MYWNSSSKDPAAKTHPIRAADGAKNDDDDNKINEPLLSTDQPAPSPSKNTYTSHLSVFDSDHIQLENITSGPPNSDLLLFENFSLDIKRGGGLAIMGPSGCGNILGLICCVLGCPC